ncbi:restriction endonuclease subunit S [Staphylococcus pseudintermedius]|nr:restriction endonuclease subunit S [Staphylococcus pseudintermedius]MDK3915595.1 restriction endonuclease subunit S [Staphylococcus pseudintermedius]
MTDLKRNVPDLRFPEFEGEWEEKKLGEFVDFGKGKLLGKKDLSEGGKYPCILYGELYTKYGAIINSIQSRTNVNPDKLKKAEKNQVLIPSSGETVEDIATASAIDVNEDVYIGGDLNILTPKKDDGKFISLSLNSVNKWNVSRFAQGKTVVHLYNNDLKKLKVNLPIQFEEQKKIGDFFSKLDRQIELEEQKLVLLEEQKKGYMQKIFSQELRFKDDNGNDYPEWEEKKLKEIGEISSGVGFPEKYQGGKIGIPFFKVSDMNLPSNQFIMKKANNYVNNQLIVENKWKVITNVPAVIFAKVGAAIMLNRKRIVMEPFLIDNNSMSYSFSMRHWDAKFGNVYFQTLNLPKYAQVGALPSYNSKDIGSIIVNLPTLREQTEIGEFFNKFTKLIEKQSRKVELLKQRKKGLLQKMFV